MRAWALSASRSRQQQVALERFERVGQRRGRRVLRVGERLDGVARGADAREPLQQVARGSRGGRDGDRLTVGMGRPYAAASAAAIREAARDLAEDYGVLGRPLVYVTGKGGVGKTTIAGALALAVAARGRCGARLRRRAAPARRAVAAHRAEPALGEWLGRHVGAPAAALLRRSQAFAYFAAATPGAAELVTIGKVVDVAPAASTTGDRRRPCHRARALRCSLRRAPSPASPPPGPMARETAERCSNGSRTRSFTASSASPLPEPMAVAELLDLERRLPATVGHGLDLVVVNAVDPDRFSDEDARRLQAAAEPRPRARDELEGGARRTPAGAAPGRAGPAGARAHGCAGRDDPLRLGGHRSAYASTGRA